MSSPFPTGASALLYPTDDLLTEPALPPVLAVLRRYRRGHAAVGHLLDPDYGTQSQENPQNIVVGEALLATVVNAVGSSPHWLRPCSF